MTRELAFSLIVKLFAASPMVRYVALYSQGELYNRQRADIGGTSMAESDWYEEMLVNPTLLKLAAQRGNIDCGGLRFIVVAYGNFYQIVSNLGEGHMSVCVDRAANPVEQFEIVQATLDSFSWV